MCSGNEDPLSYLEGDIWEEMEEKVKEYTDRAEQIMKDEIEDLGEKYEQDAEKRIFDELDTIEIMKQALQHFEKEKKESPEYKKLMESVKLPCETKKGD
jgi:CBS-domain-containing membrane protein